MRASVVVALAVCISCALFFGCDRNKSQPLTGGDATKTRFLAIQDVSKAVVLAQGWDDETANWFYNIDQGSQLLPYKWFLHLEQADSQELFRSTKNIRKLGYLPRTPGGDNPDGLPIGFVKNEGTDREWVGLTCAACHTSQINYQDTAFLVDGAPALSNIGQFMLDLASSLQTTLDEEEKFDRFATNVLGPSADTAALRVEMQKMLDIRNGYNDRNLPKDPQLEHGYARIDAFGSILNEASVRFIDLPANHELCNAPVSIPFLWDTPQHDVVQWNGSAPNGIIGSLARNTGEVLGVFGGLEIPEEAPLVGYRSTVEINNLRKIESTVEELFSPLWPQELPAIDKAAAERGKAYFTTYCIECHAHINRTDPNRKIIASMDAVGTDPNMFQNFADRKVKTGRLEGTRIDFKPLGARFPAETSAESLLVHEVIGAILGSWKAAPPDQIAAYRQEVSPGVAASVSPQYKGRPLNGIWATAPYLHNGSVPNLYQLLLPAAERDKEFWVGSREFDPQDVGFVSTQADGLFRFDTSVTGNKNVGHEYGTGVALEDGGDDKDALDEQQRRDLLEYLKSL